MNERRLRAAWIVLIATACTKESGSGPKPLPAPPPQAQLVGDAAVTQKQDPNNDEESPCPKQGGPQTTAVQRIGIYGKILPHQNGRIWYSTKHFNVIDNQGRVLERLKPQDVPKGFLGMESTWWFVQRCDDAGCGQHGTGKTIERIDRKTGDRLKLVSGENEVVFAEVVGTHLYWATFGPYGKTGELRRIPVVGGKVETLWSGLGVNTVLIAGGMLGTAYVADDNTVSSIALGVSVGNRIEVGKPILLAKDLKDVRGIAADDKHVYIVDRGDPYWDSAASGYVLRVPHGGGKVEKLAGPVKWPTVVGVDNDRVYFMGDGYGDVWAIPKTGGAASILIPTPPKDWPCRTTTWMNVTDLGLTYLRMSKGFDTVTNQPIDWGTLWSIQRDWMKDPQQQFKDFVAKEKAAGRPLPKSVTGEE